MKPTASGDELGFPEHPWERCFWAAPGLLGGAYPGDVDPAVAAVKLRSLAAAGVTLWLDLTDAADGLQPYGEMLVGLRNERLRRLSLPVPDLTAAPNGVIEQALDVIDREIAAGGTVYVHCWGGKGRTGTVLGCYLARTLGGDEGLEELNRRRDQQVRHRRDVGVRVPETEAQCAVVRRWGALDQPGGTTSA